MALNPTVAATGMTTALKKAASLKEDENGTLVDTGEKYDNSTFAADFAGAYNEYVMGGMVPGTVNSGGDVSILEAALDGKETSPAKLGLAFANYWNTVCVTPGAPMHGGVSVVSSINNATSLASAFTSAIQASLTTKESKPYYLKFVQNIETMAVLKIQWTITEMVVVGTSVVPIAFPDSIS